MLYIVIYYFLLYLSKFLLLIIPLLVSVAYLTLLERKVIASMQKRIGPNIVGFFGLLQPLSDGFKLFLKETIIPTTSNKMLFFFSPIITFTLSLISWLVIPLCENILLADINIGLLYVFAISSLGVYGIILSGWSSNSKYSFLGALRSAAQMISYEVSIGLIIISILICVGSLSLREIVLFQKHIWFFIPHVPAFLMFFISCLAETNRPPFDLPEAEAELVAGYNVEYSSLTFALFFLAEYSNIILMSSLCVILFFGGWLNPLPFFFFFVPDFVCFGLKVSIFCFFFIWIRATLPRYRYDQLMNLGWKVFLPLSLSWVVFTSGILLIFDGFPFNF